MTSPKYQRSTKYSLPSQSKSFRKTPFSLKPSGNINPHSWAKLRFNVVSNFSGSLSQATRCLIF